MYGGQIMNFWCLGSLQKISSEHPEQSWIRWHSPVPQIHQPCNCLPLWNGNRRKTASNQDQTRIDVDVEDPSKYCQPCWVFQGAAYACLQWICPEEFWGRQKIFYPDCFRLWVHWSRPVPLDVIYQWCQCFGPSQVIMESSGADWRLSVLLQRSQSHGKKTLWQDGNPPCVPGSTWA